MNTKIVVVGGGAIGSAVACALAQQADSELQITLCDAADTLAQYQGQHYDPRVLALSQASCDFLAELGVWDDIAAQRLCQYRKMAVWDAEGSGYIEFDAADAHRDNLGVIVESSVVIRALQRRLQSFNNLRWLRDTRIEHWHNTTEGSTLLTEAGEEISAALVLAADGAQSALRELAGIRSRQWSYHHHAIIGTVVCEKPHERCARQWFSHQGPLALLPLAGPEREQNSHYCSLVWSQDSGRAHALMALEPEAFCQELTRASESVLGQITQVQQRFEVPLEQSHALDYGCPGLALVGDAAHRIHPLAGQGANLGFYDAAVLVKEIARARQRNIALAHPSLIERYQRHRKAHNLMAMASMEGFKRLFQNQSPIAHILRNRGMSWVNDHLPLKRKLMQLAAGQ